MRSRAALACYALILGLALVAVRPTGDGGEYLLAAHALATHETPEVQRNDVDWLARTEPRWRRVTARIAEGMEAGELVPLPSVRRAEGGGYYSLHFWLYSLFTVPALWVTEALGLRPTLALAGINALAACGALAYVFRRFGSERAGLVRAAMFLLCGTILYLGWTGPEVMTASAVLVACLAASDGKLGLATAAGGLAAAQNPSAVFVLPYVWARARARRASPSPHEYRLVALGLLLALAPYAFFYVEFRLVSLIARFAIDLRLISLERAWSLVFDLNQGMIMGLGGLLLGCLAVAVGALATTRGPARRALALRFAATAVLVTFMAIPTFSIHNWNSGNVVFVRYGYWLAMPLLAFAFEAIDLLAVQWRRAIAGACAACQLLVLALNGPFGGAYSYVRHSWAAKLVLRHAPWAYNPVPEIFYERSLGWEAPVDSANVVVWPYRGTPGKIMVRAGHLAESTRVCPRGSVVTSGSTHAASGGWTYLDAPFGCRAP